MAIYPPQLTLVTVVGGPILKLDGTTPEIGTVTFEAPGILMVGDICIPQKYIATLDELGEFRIPIPAGDDTDLSEFGWAYHITERFTESTHVFDAEVWEVTANAELITFYVDLRRANEITSEGTGPVDIGVISNLSVNETQTSRIDAVECSTITIEAGDCCVDHEDRIDDLETCCTANTACCSDHETRIDALEVCCTANTACCADHETRIDALEACCTANTACCADHETRIDTIESTLVTVDTRLDTAEACCADHETRIDALELCCTQQQAKVLKIEFAARAAPLLIVGGNSLVLTWPTAFASAVYTISADVQASDANKARITLSVTSQTASTATFSLVVSAGLPIALGSVFVQAVGYRLA